MGAESPAISLEQWRALLAVVDCGGYAQAAEALHKSQSAITYAVQKIEALLAVELFDLVGRRAVLTEAGHVVARRARTLVEEAMLLEKGARAMAAHWKPEIRLAVNAVAPTKLVLECLAEFSAARPETRIELHELVLSPEEALLDGRAELAIAAQAPQGFRSEFLGQVRFVAVAHAEHPLHELQRQLTLRDLRRHRQIVLRDSGAERRKSGGWLAAEQRWTVSNLATSIEAVRMGLGFAWLPEDHIRRDLARGGLRPLALGEPGTRFLDLSLVYREEELDSRDMQHFAQLLRRTFGKRARGARRKP